MDFLTTIQLIIAIIGIPASIYVFFQIRRDFRTVNLPLEEARATHKTYVHLISSLSDRSDRTLLTFDKSNREKPGTFEHLVWGYWRQFEEFNRGSEYSTRAEEFIYNPAGVLRASEFVITIYRSNRFVVVVSTLMLLSFAVPMGITAGIGDLFGSGTFWHYVLSIPIFVIFVPLGIVMCWRSLRKNRRNLSNAIKALESIRQYVAVLEEMGIVVQQEFTQLKSKAANSSTSS